MDDLIESCRAASTFPKNLLCHNTYEYALDTYVRELNKRELDLFCADGEGALDFWDLEQPTSSFQRTRLHNTAGVRNHLRISDLPNSLDPKCRFVFIHGVKGSSREILRVTREMLATVMTYHQINPSFLDFLFSFGKQDHANPQDFHYSGFRHDIRLNDLQKAPRIPALKRSGRALQLCYSLRSVERSGPTEWSIRALAAHHTFDVEHGQSSWLVLKGNEFMKNKLMAESTSREPNAPVHFGSVSAAFSSALSTHQILCNWAGENWRWYINDLECEVQKITQKTLSLQVLHPQSPPTLKSRFSRVETGELVLNEPPRSAKKAGSKKSKATLPNNGVAQGMATQPVHLVNIPDPNLPPDPLDDPLAGDFTFKDLQRIEEIEELANEALLVLSLNSEVLSTLEQQYQTIVDPKVCPNELKQDGEERVGRFVEAVGNVLREIQIQKTRIQTLLRLLADRKILLYGILDFRSVQASKQLAEKAQFSAEQVEWITQEMHDLAEKTKREAVSMKIITLVTLFFLPGTFISTLMSTDIVQFQKQGSGGPIERIVSAGAIHIFLATTLPLMLLTFLAWGVISKLSKRRERKEKEKRMAAARGQP